MAPDPGGKVGLEELQSEIWRLQRTRSMNIVK